MFDKFNSEPEPFAVELSMKDVKSLLIGVPVKMVNHKGIRMPGRGALAKMGLKLVDLRKPVDGDHYITMNGVIAGDIDNLNTTVCSGKRFIVKNLNEE